MFGNADGSGLNAAPGYRTQTVKTDGYADAIQQSGDVRDVREGVVLALNFTLQPQPAPGRPNLGRPCR